jgi:hypothetical protein
VDASPGYFTELAAAFVRGRLPDAPPLPAGELIALGRRAGLRLHKFKSNAGLPRVRRVLGVLRGLAPADLLDVGSGRGTFLWPMLDAFPDHARRQPRAPAPVHRRFVPRAVGIRGR